MERKNRKPKTLMTLILVTFSAILILCGQLYAENPENESSSTATSIGKEGSNKITYVLNQMVVKFTDDTVATWDFADRIGGTIVDHLENSDVYLIEMNRDINTYSLSEDLDTMEIVDYAHPNYLINPVHPVQGSYPFSDDAKIGSYENQPPAQTLQLSATHLMATGSGVTVAVIDGGVDYTHPVLADKAVSAYDFVDNDNDAFDEPGGLNSGHGTFVAGVIHLVAPDAEILTYRITDPYGIGDGFSLAKAIEQAVLDGSQIINLSVVLMHEHLAVRDAINFAEANGVSVVAAAGNNYSETPIYPSAYDNALAVTAIDFDMELTEFSNYGSHIDVCAPGYYIYSAYVEGNYAWWSGTSFSTPFVAGQAALLKEKLPNATPLELKNLIKNTSDNIDDLNPNFTGKLGSGLINPVAALNMIKTETADVEPDTVYFEVEQGVIFIVAPFDVFALTSTNAPAAFTISMIGSDTQFVYLYDSLYGYTDDSITVTLANWDFPVGTYYNTFRFQVEGVDDPVDLVVSLTVLEPSGSPDTAWSYPYAQGYTAPYGEDVVQTGMVFIGSSNAPAAYTVEFADTPDIVQLIDTTGYTHDSLLFDVVSTAAMAPGLYVDTLLFYVEGVVNNPEMALVYLYVDTLQGSDTAWVRPYAQGYTAPAGENLVQTGAVFVGSTNAPASYTVEIIDVPDFVQLPDSTGTTGDSLFFDIVATADMPAGVYIDTLSFFVDGCRNNPYRAIVLLQIGTPQDNDTAWVYPYAQGYTALYGEDVVQTGMVFIGSSNAPAAYTVEFADTPDIVRLIDSTGYTNDSLLFDVVSTAAMAPGLYVDTLLFYVEGVVNNPKMALVYLYVDTLQGSDTAWVYPYAQGYTAPAGENLVQTGAVFVGSTNAPASYTVEIIDVPDFVQLPDSTGTTGDSLFFDIVATADMPAGVYIDTLSFFVDGCRNNPYRAIVLLHVQGESEDSAWVVQDSMLNYMTLVEGTYSVIFDGFFVNSTNAPANYSVEVIGPTYFTTILDTAGVTNGYVHFTVVGTGLTVGTYSDTLLFYVEGCVNSPVMYVLTLEIIPYQGPVEDSAYIIPDTLYFTMYEGVEYFTPPTDYVHILSTNAPANYTTKVIDTDLVFVFPYDSTYGTTNDSLAVSVYNCTLPSCEYFLPEGIYYNHMMIRVDGVEQVLMLVVELTVEREPGETASINPDFLNFTAPVGTENLLFGNAVLMSSNAPAAFTATTLPGGSQVSYPFDTVGTTNDSVTIAVNPALAPDPGRYHDTIAYFVEGVDNPVILVVNLEITDGISDTAWVSPLSQYFSAPYGEDLNQTGAIFVGSSNAPVPFTLGVLDSADFIFNYYGSWSTGDSAYFEVTSTASMAPGTYTDTLLIYVESVDNSPLISVVYLTIDTVAVDQAAVAYLQNYPNPFNPRTNIEYSLARASYVRLEIFNVIGQQVQVLVDEYKTAGTHTITWEGKDSRGRSVSSGIYFYRLQTDDMALTKKMILLK